MNYKARVFSLPELKGLSKKQIDVHLALYEGYVKHTNLILDKIESLRQTDAEGNSYLINELRRRFGFEFDGMRMHEYYFEQFEDGSLRPQAESPLMDLVSARYGSWDGFIAHLKEVCGTRGIGWTIVYFDPAARALHTAWVNDHEIGQLSGLPIMLAIDMWEHAYMVDYVPADKKLYVDAFLENLNWAVVEKRMLSGIV
jgi:Fe-Mn family superoxide dismutase